MREVINTEGTLIYRQGEPVYTMSCDRTHGHAMLEYEGNIFRVYSMAKELWTVQFGDGRFLLGVGNPYYQGSYRKELLALVERDEQAYKWLRDCFNKCGIHTVEVATMVQIMGCTHLTVGESGLWRLVLPDGKVQIGMGTAAAPDSSAMKAVSTKMRDYYSTRFMSYISNLFTLLEPLEFEAPYQDSDSSSVEIASPKKNRRTNWLVRLGNRISRLWRGFKFLFSCLRSLRVEATD